MQVCQVSVCVPLPSGSWWGHTSVYGPVDKTAWDKIGADIYKVVCGFRPVMGDRVPEYSVYVECLDGKLFGNLKDMAKASAYAMCGKLIWRWEFIVPWMCRPESGVEFAPSEEKGGGA